MILSMSGRGEGVRDWLGGHMAASQAQHMMNHLLKKISDTKYMIKWPTVGFLRRLCKFMSLYILGLTELPLELFRTPLTLQGTYSDELLNY